MSNFNNISNNIINDCNDLQPLDEALLGIGFKKFNFNKRLFLNIRRKWFGKGDSGRASLSWTGKKLTSLFNDLVNYVEKLKKDPTPPGETPFSKKDMSKTEPEIIGGRRSSFMTDYEKAGETIEDSFKLMPSLNFNSDKIIWEMNNDIKATEHVTSHMMAVAYMQYMLKSTNGGVRPLKSLNQIKLSKEFTVAKVLTDSDFNLSPEFYRELDRSPSRITVDFASSHLATQGIGFPKYTAYVTALPGQDSFAVRGAPSILKVGGGKDEEKYWDSKLSSKMMEIMIRFDSKESRDLFKLAISKKEGISALETAEAKLKAKTSSTKGEDMGKMAPLFMQISPVNTRTFKVIIARHGEEDTFLGKNLVHGVDKRIQSILMKYIAPTSSEESDIYDRISAKVQINPFDERGNLTDKNAFFDAVVAYARDCANANNIGFYVQDFVDSCYWAERRAAGEKHIKSRQYKPGQAIVTARGSYIKPAHFADVNSKILGYFKMYFNKYFMYMTTEEKEDYDKTIIGGTSDYLRKSFGPGSAPHKLASIISAIK